jgi:hypothetical protein
MARFATLRMPRTVANPSTRHFREAAANMLLLPHKLSIECFAHRRFWGTVKRPFSEFLSAPQFTKMVKSSMSAILIGLRQLAIPVALQPPFLLIRP